jgi:ubiquinone/menaquinone biosynthesis C-methylase UbiE
MLGDITPGRHSMTTTASTAQTYILGSSEAEMRRLMRQAEILNPSTRQILVEAGLDDGMRVLDIGSGAGDVAMLAAELVGRRGAVVGVDRSPDALAVARARATTAGLSNVRFLEGDLHTVAPDDHFDAVIGRAVLPYTSDPPAALRALVRRLRPGGIVAFQEFNLGPAAWHCVPSTSLWERYAAWFRETMDRAGVQMQMGYDLHRSFVAAGLPAPRMSLSSPLICGPDPAGYEWLAETLRSMLPLTLKLGVATADEVDIDTLAERLRAATLAADAVIKVPDFVGAWARKPAAGPDTPAWDSAETRW